MSVGWDIFDPHFKTDTFAQSLRLLKNQFLMATSEGLLPIVAAGNDPDWKNGVSSS